MLAFRISLLLQIIVVISSSVAFNSTEFPIHKECEGLPHCAYILESTLRIFYTERFSLLSGPCFDPERNSTPAVNANNIQVQNFPPKSSWFGAYLADMYGIALSPLFVPHRNLSCTEYILTQVSGEGIALEMKHYAVDKVDFRFDFNQRGWIVYKRRYGCSPDSRQVDSTRIIDTDYENYIIIMGCSEVFYHDSVAAEQEPSYHVTGYLLLLKSEAIPNQIYDKIQGTFTELQVYDWAIYNLTAKEDLLKNRKSDCQQTKVPNKNPLCPKSRLKTAVLHKKEVVSELKAVQMSKTMKHKKELMSERAVAYIRRLQEEHVVPVEQISVMVLMFISLAISLYYTHFSI